MNSRERINLALNHHEPDRVPIDCGGCEVTSMHVSVVYRLRQALGLDAPGTPVKVIEPMQMLAEVKPDLVEVLGGDLLPLVGTRGWFGFEISGWKPWTTFDGTPVLVPAGFNTEPESNGDILLYPEGDKSAPASGRMPYGGWYFDPIVRQPPIEDDRLNLEDNLEEFGEINEDTLMHLRRESERLFRETDKAIFANVADSSFGDIALVPGPSLKHPRGIRDVAEWYISLRTRRAYIGRVFERQCEVAISNLTRIHDAVGNRVSVLLVSGTDFGAQNGPLISPTTYRELFAPFHRQVNDWVHAHTTWKTFIHTCGAVMPFIEDFIEAGFDILNPLQISAAGMDPLELKHRFGDRLTLWGGGVDTQRTLPFGTPDEVRAEARRCIDAFAPGGGYVFGAVHNIQAGVPIPNVLALFESARQFGGYPFRARAGS